MAGRYGRSRRSVVLSPMRRVGVVSCSAVLSFGIVNAISTTPSGVGPTAGTAQDVVRGDDEASRSDRAVRWFAGAVVRVDPGPASSPSPEPTKTPDPNVKPEATQRLPEPSGSGKRVVFDITAQQVWLVEKGNEVARTYMVSGSRFDQLPTGTYEVYSVSRHTISWHGTETMEYMVRFHQGERAAIGFHDLPVDTVTGDEVQTLAELGTPLSDGCIRQEEVDAKALWGFAPVGTTVVVVRT